MSSAVGFFDDMDDLMNELDSESPSTTQPPKLSNSSLGDSSENDDVMDFLGSDPSPSTSKTEPPAKRVGLSTSDPKSNKSPKETPQKEKRVNFGKAFVIPPKSKPKSAPSGLLRAASVGSKPQSIPMIETKPVPSASGVFSAEEIELVLWYTSEMQKNRYDVQKVESLVDKVISLCHMRQSPK